MDRTNYTFIYFFNSKFIHTTINFDINKKIKIFAITLVFEYNNKLFLEILINKSTKIIIKH
jgi:hypothetical protein